MQSKAGVDKEIDRAGVDKEIDRAGVDKEIDRAGVDKEIDGAGVDKEVDRDCLQLLIAPRFWREAPGARTIPQSLLPSSLEPSWASEVSTFRSSRLSTSNRMAGSLVGVRDVRAPRDDLAPNRRLNRVSWPASRGPAALHRHLLLSSTCLRF
jgi:hypothetical protein